MAFDFGIGFVNDLLDLIDTEFPAGAVLEMRSGAAPGTAAAATGTVIATVVLPAAPWAAAAAKSKAKAGTWQDAAADAAGTLAHFRLRATGDTNLANAAPKRIEGTITATGGGGDMTVDNVVVAAGQQITITAFSIGA